MSAHPMDTAISVPVDRFVPARRSAPAGPARPQGRSRHWDRWWLGALVLGALAWLLATIALPVASLLGRSFWDDAGRFTGLAQFIAYARMPGVAQSLFNSLWLSAVSSTVCVLLAYATPMAWYAAACRWRAGSARWPWCRCWRLRCSWPSA
jgi:iron(III) transport system permease protein